MRDRCLGQRASYQTGTPPPQHPDPDHAVLSELLGPFLTHDDFSLSGSMPPHPPSQCLRQQYLYLNFTCAQSSSSLPQPVKDVPGHLQQCPLTTDQRRFPEIPWKFRDKRQTAQGKEHSYTALYSQCLAHSRCSGIFADCLVGILRIKHGLKIVLADW